MNESHKGMTMFNLISQVLEGIIWNHWHIKLLSADIDGAKNMTGRVQGAFRRFQSICFAGFYRIWCANHKLDLAIQAVMKTVMKDCYRAHLLLTISYLRRQNTLHSEMGSTCPSVSQTRSLSHSSSSGWLSRHRERIVSYVEEKNASILPSTE